jgi:hypothetical protein
MRGHAKGRQRQPTAERGCPLGLPTLPRVFRVRHRPELGGGYLGYIPNTENAQLGLALATQTCTLIEAAEPTWWFIESPRGHLRKLGIFDGMDAVIRHTVS